MGDMYTMNTPMSEVSDGNCPFCKKTAPKETDTHRWHYCKLAPPKRSHFMYPCTLSMQQLCQRAKGVA